MVFKEKKLTILIYLLRYGRITNQECRNILRSSSSSIAKDWKKLREIPGIFQNGDGSTLFSFYYIISHRIPEFYDHENKKILLKDVKSKSPIETEINYSSNETLREAFA